MADDDYNYYERRPSLVREKRTPHRSKSRPGYRVEKAEHTHIDIRVADKHARGCFTSITVTGARDAGNFQRMVDNIVRSNPSDPLVISINGHRPWLEDIMRTCIDDHYSEPGLTNREVQFASTVQLPQKSDKRTMWVPWTFIVDEMNLPQVYYWTFGLQPPSDDRCGDVESYAFRVGAWTCGRGAYRFDDRIPVIILFTRQTSQIAEHVVTDLLFPQIVGDDDFNAPRMDEEGPCWLFYVLYDLLTDWQNIIREVERRLAEAELNSKGRDIPVKLRTRSMHKEVDRIYELNEYLRFHSRSFKKLSKLKESVPKKDQDDRLWEQLDDATDDLDQWGYYLDSLKERFNNLIELEFNIENANQSDNSRFLSILGTLFLPVSFLASLFGITTVTWPVIWYLYTAIPLFIISCVFTGIFPWAVRRWQHVSYPAQKEHVILGAGEFTMLGKELPDSTDCPPQKTPARQGMTRGADVQIGKGDGSRRRRRRSKIAATLSSVSSLEQTVSEPRRRSRSVG